MIAAGALYALQYQRDRLAEDHENAQRLAHGLQGMKGVMIDPATVETNIVNFEVPDQPAPEIVKELAQQGVAVLATGPHRIRAVTNLMVTREQVDRAVEAIAQTVGGALLASR